MADNRRRARSAGEQKSRSAPSRPRSLSFAAGQNFHEMNLHEMRFYPDPCPAFPVVNLPAHTAELDAEDWKTARLPVGMKTPTVHELLDVFPTVEEACKAKNWATCARFLGAGGFGQVYLGFRYSELAMPLAQRHLCAVKLCYIGKESVPKTDWKARQAQQAAKPTMTPIRSQVVASSVETEVNLLRWLKHHNIVRMLDSFAVEETRAAYLVLEYCDSGDLFWEMDNMRNHRFTIPQARYYFVQVVAAVTYLHSKGIAHMDIKPENVLLKITPDGKGKVAKLADFGLSIVTFGVDERGNFHVNYSRTLQGTLPYFAPEMLAIRYANRMEQVWRTYTPQPVSRVDAHFKGMLLHYEPVHQRRPIAILPGYREKYYRPLPCDVYACGVLLFFMITEDFPYDDERWDVDGIGLDNVFRLQPKTYFSFMDMETYQFICWLLEPVFKYDEQQESVGVVLRPQAQEIATHKWMHGEKCATPGLPNYLDQWQTMHFERPVPRVVTEAPVLVPAAALPHPTQEKSALIPSPSIPNRGRRRDGVDGCHLL